MKSSSKKMGTGPPWGQRERCRSCLVLSMVWTAVCNSFQIIQKCSSLLSASKVWVSCFCVDSSRTDTHEQKRGSSHDNGKKVDVIDLTLDSSSEDELDDEPPPKRACPSLSPVSPPPNKGYVSKPQTGNKYMYFGDLCTQLCHVTSSVTNIDVALFPFRVLNLHSQASPVTRAPSMPPVETSYIPPPPPLIQDYRHYYHTTNDLPGRLTTCFKG